MKLFKKTAGQELKEEVVRVKDSLEDLEIGSEEYLNATKSENQLCEAIGKLRRLDINTLITGGVSITMFILYMCFSETHITDTRAIQFAKSIFKR